MLGHGAVPLSLFALGMGLAEYRIREGLNQSLVLCAIKLGIQPLVVWLLACALGLPPLETQAAAMLASLSVVINV